MEDRRIARFTHLKPDFVSHLILPAPIFADGKSAVFVGWDDLTVTQVYAAPTFFMGPITDPQNKTQNRCL